MNKEVKDMWIEALRSGGYEQGRRGLRYRTGKSHTYKYCCLGVLCDLAVKSGIQISIENIEQDFDQIQISVINTYYDGCSQYPPEAVHGYSKLKGSYYECLASMNDSGKSFEEIADYIEENL